MLAGESMDMDLQRNRTDGRAEIKQPDLLHGENTQGEQVRPGRPPGRKHKGCVTCLIPNQSARSRALASAVDSPTTLTALEVWEEIKLVLDTITSSTGPLSSPGDTRSVQS